MTKSKGIRRKYYDEEIWLLEVEFEKFCRATLSYKTYVKYCNTVYDFLKTYPKKVSPSDYFTCDVEDWALARRRDSAQATVDAEVNILRYFFNWLSSHTGRDILNPATRRMCSRSRQEPTFVSLDQLQSLAQSARGVDTEIVSRMLAAETPAQIARSLGMSASTVRQHFLRLRIAADFPITLKELPAALCRLYLRLGEVQVLESLKRDYPSPQPPLLANSEASE